MKYSISTGGIYPVSMLQDYEKAGTLPDDLIDITDEERNEILGGKKLTLSEGGARVWAFPEPDFEQVVSAKIVELSAAYAAEITGDVEYPVGSGKIYQGDQRSLDSLLSRLRIGTDPSHWRAKDNSNIAPFTIADVDALRAMIELRAATAVEKLHSKKDAVLAAESIEAVQSITWED